MTKIFENPNAKGFPVKIDRKSVEGWPKWSDTMLQYPVTLPEPDRPKAATSPFRVIFSEPQLARAGDGSKALISSYWDVVVFETPSSGAVVCDGMPL
ncbi:hypothetical protein RhiJN_07751 [Ceratobasidium sp. AG-Ba]|nr:hypothetical protein RhiJN_07751 [Ceratobasidium sp. AG-Ba]QRW08580.1 hypothetical protein RhiLY_07579 [Ceratobasidium sp. AG-Ba]